MGKSIDQRPLVNFVLSKLLHVLIQHIKVCKEIISLGLTTHQTGYREKLAFFNELLSEENTPQIIIMSYSCDIQ